MSESASEDSCWNWVLTAKQVRMLTTLANLQSLDLSVALDRALQAATDRCRAKDSNIASQHIHLYKNQINVDRQFDALKLKSKLKDLAAGANSAMDSESILTAFLRQFYLTHESIALLFRTEIVESYRGANHLSDACSLVREQIEKPFYVALLCSDFDRWSTVMSRDSVRKKFENFVIDSIEYKNIADRRDWYSTTGPAAFRQLAATCGISDEQLEAIRLCTLNRLTGGASDKKLKDLLPESVPDLPTIQKLVSKSNLGPGLGSALAVLFRWHAQYSQYAHALEEKVFVSSSGRARNYRSSKATEACENIVSQALSVSFTCSVFGFSIPFTDMTDADMAGRLFEGWEIAREQSYLGNALWEEFASAPFGSLLVKP